MHTTKHLESLEFNLEYFDNKHISPEEFDIEHVAFVVDIARSLFDQKDRPTVSFDIKKGSVIPTFMSEKKHILLAQKNITLDVKQKLTSFCFTNGYSLKLRASTQEALIFSTDPSHYTPDLEEGFPVSGGAVLRGEIKLLGGISKYHIVLKNKSGNFKIKCTKEQIKKIDNNPLFSLYEVEVAYKLNSSSGEIDPNSYTLNHIKSFVPTDENYLNNCIEYGSKKWKGEGQDWLNSFRYGKTNPA